MKVRSGSGASGFKFWREGVKAYLGSNLVCSRRAPREWAVGRLNRTAYGMLSHKPSSRL